jgi:hypothetical protein
MYSDIPSKDFQSTMDTGVGVILIHITLFLIIAVLMVLLHDTAPPFGIFCGSNTASEDLIFREYLLEIFSESRCRGPAYRWPPIRSPVTIESFFHTDDMSA